MTYYFCILIERPQLFSKEEQKNKNTPYPKLVSLKSFFNVTVPTCNYSLLCLTLILLKYWNIDAACIANVFFVVIFFIRNSLFRNFFVFHLS